MHPRSQYFPIQIPIFIFRAFSRLVEKKSFRVPIPDCILDKRRTNVRHGQHRNDSRRRLQFVAQFPTLQDFGVATHPIEGTGFVPKFGVRH